MTKEQYFAGDINKPAVITSEDIKRMENEKANVLKAQQEIDNARKMATKEVYIDDKEYNFWTSLGFKQSDMISPKTKGRFFLAVALVAGYFAYKKFKK